MPIHSDGIIAARRFALWLLIGGLSILSWPVLILTDYKVSSDQAYVLLVLFSLPHFTLSYLLFYSQKGLAREHRVVSLVFPVLAGVVLFMGSRYPISIQTLSQLTLLALFLHLSKQSYGVSLYFANDHKNSAHHFIWKKFLLAANLAWGFVAWDIQQTTRSEIFAFRGFIQSLNLPPIVHSSLLIVAAALTSVCLVYWMLRLRKESRLSQSLLIWTPLMAMIIWCFPALRLAAFGLVPVMHGIQYLPFAWAKFKMQRRTALAFVISFTLTGLAAYLAFQKTPYVLASYLASSAGYWISALYIFLNVHHFALERVMWRRKHFTASMQEEGSNRRSSSQITVENRAS